MRSNIRAGIAAAVLILGITTACVPTKSPAPSALAGRTIVIDPGHNG
jgi:N-acetylmuramoyl-L-alanine amidase